MRLAVLLALTLPVAAALTLVPRAGAGAAAADEFPSRPIRLIVPWPPGGISDTSARILGQHMSASMGQPVVVDNRPGAASTIGTDIVTKSAADGHTWLYADVTTTAINATTFSKLPYDTVKDLSPVTMAGVSPLFLAVHASVPAKTARDLVALAKAKPGTLNFASAGTGSTLHLAAEMFRAAASINIVHVPFKGSGPAMGSLISGEVAMIFSASPPILPHIKSGALRALATTKPARSRVLPDVPALAEIYPGFQIFIVNGVLGPAGVPRERIVRVGAEVAKAVRLPEVQQRLEALGVETRTSSPAELAAFLSTEVARFRKLIRDSGIKIE